MNPATPAYRPALPQDAKECVVLRGQTRQNAVSPERLRALGITVQSWGDAVRDGQLTGEICSLGGRMVGYCFGSCHEGEVVVLALLPQAEGQGIGRELLARVVGRLRSLGHQRLYLGCSADPASRSHGFYRHLGWVSTGQFDAHGDEVLELLSAPAERVAGTPAG